MGEKVYRPILDDDEHLLHSSENPDRVRGLSRDGNNENPNIPEWEEVDLDELRENTTSYSDRKDAAIARKSREERTLREKLVDEVVIPAARDIITRILEYGTAKVETWIEEKVVPAAKSKTKIGWENLKLIMSVVKDPDMETKASQIIAEQQKKSMEIEIVNELENEEEKTIILSRKEAEFLLKMTRQSALRLVVSLRILNNSVVMDDGTNPEQTAIIQKEIERLYSKDVKTQIDLLLEDKNKGLIDEDSISMLRAFRNGMFIGNGTPIPISRYIEVEK